MFYFDGFSRMNSSKIKLKHYIATHTFHSSNGMKEFKNAFKHRKKSSDWFDTETPDVKKHFFNSLCNRKIVDANSWDSFDSYDYAIMYQLFFGKGDFFFCHWYAIDEQSIIDRLTAGGGDKFFITMATLIDPPKIDVERMQSYLQKLK